MSKRSILDPRDKGSALAPTTQAPGPDATVLDAGIETGFKTPRRIGLTIAFLVFGVFGVWAAFAPLDSAAPAPGTITVRSYKKVIQHLEGGIVKDIYVQNGDVVEAGDVLLEIDATQSLAQLDIFSGQLLTLTALEARLAAERDELDAVEYPDIVMRNPVLGRPEMAAQDQIFRARKTAQEGAIAVLEQRIGQLESRVKGLQALRESKLTLAASFDEELADTRSLLEEGFADKLRLRELERSHATLAGEAAELEANIASTEIQIGETRMQIIQQRNEFQTEVVNELAEVQTQLKDVRERVTALTDVVARTKVRAPDSGIVNGMQVHTIGGVIPAGQTVAEIVPGGDELLIEGRVSPIDIDRVRVGQEAMVRLSSFNSKSVPTLYGTVLSLSADALYDENTSQSYYLSRVTITPESLADLRGLELVPGMPAEVFINTGSRTFLQYLVRPLSNAMARSFNED